MSHVYQIRTFLANLVFTIMVSALWSLCFEMPFMTIDRILFSGRKQSLSKHSKGYDSTASGKEIYQSKESSIMYDNPGESNVTHYDLIGKRNREIDTEYINDEPGRSIDKIYYIKPIKHDETWSAMNSDNRRSDYINVDLCRIFDKCGRPRANSNGKESDSINSNPDQRAKPNQFLKDSG